jgi:hypothetical protein
MQISISDSETIKGIHSVRYCYTVQYGLEPGDRVESGDCGASLRSLRENRYGIYIDRRHQSNKGRDRDDNSRTGSVTEARLETRGVL